MNHVCAPDITLKPPLSLLFWAIGHGPFLHPMYVQSTHWSFMGAHQPRPHIPLSPPQSTSCHAQSQHLDLRVIV